MHLATRRDVIGAIHYQRSPYRVRPFTKFVGPVTLWLEVPNHANARTHTHDPVVFECYSRFSNKTHSCKRQAAVMFLNIQQLRSYVQTRYKKLILQVEPPALPSTPLSALSRLLIRMQHPENDDTVQQLRGSDQGTQKQMRLHDKRYYSPGHV